MSLRTKLLLPYFVLFTLAFTAVHFLWLPWYTQKITSEIRIQEKNYLQLLAESLTPDLLENDLMNIYSTLDGVRSQRVRWLKLQFQKPDGIVIYPFGGSFMDDNARENEIHFQVSYKTDILGMLVIEFDLDNLVAENIDRIHALELMLLSLLLVVSMLSIIFQELWIRSPLSKLVDATDAVAKGHYGTRLPPAANDEIGHFNRSFDRMRVQLADREKQLAQFLKAIDEAGNAIFITGKDGVISYINPEFTKITGYRKSEAVGKNARILNSGKQDTRYFNKMWDTIRSGATWGEKIINRRKNGELYHVEQTVSPITDEEGEITGYVAIQIDDTERIKQQKELQRVNENLSVSAKEAKEKAFEAGVANKAKSDFIATMSHEIRTPLNGILGMVELMEETQLNNKQQEHLDTIRFSGDSLLSIINDILDISKLEAGKMEIEAMPFSPQELLISTANILQNQAEEKGLFLEIKHDPKIPEALLGDPIRLRQVMINYISNAIKFTKEGIISLEMKLLNEFPDQANFRVAVKDTGIGIPQDKISLLFKDFSQADSSISRRYGGTGLGLAISKRIIEKMNGKIGCDSRAGEGSIFWFEVSLPLSKLEYIKETPKSATEVIEDIVPLNILLAEDNVVNQKVAVAFLELDGHKVSVVENGNEAVHAVRNMSFDLVLMDIQMPEMNGGEATIEIRKFNKDIPIVALTANAIKGETKKWLNMGMNEFLTKPVGRKTLSQMVSSVTSGRNLKAAAQTENETNVENELLNKKWLEALKRDLSKDLFDMTINTTMEQAEAVFLEIHAHMDQQELDAIAKKSHKIKGSLAQMGISGLSDIASKMENASLEKDNNNLIELIAEFDIAMLKTKSLLKEF